MNRSGTQRMTVFSQVPKNSKSFFSKSYLDFPESFLSQEVRNVLGLSNYRNLIALSGFLNVKFVFVTVFH